MIPGAREVRLRRNDRKVLEARCRSAVTLQRDLKRARIVLLAAAGRSTRSERYRSRRPAAPAAHPFHRTIDADPVPSSATELRENINETIDASVFERWRSDPAYRPPNLSAWADKHKLKPEDLTSTVRADDPSTPI
jgi:hypothetical protein